MIAGNETLQFSDARFFDARRLSLIISAFFSKSKTPA